MKIDKIQPYINSKTTGYAAAAGVGLTVLSGITKNKSVKRFHKPMAFMSIFLTALHIGITEFYHYKYRNK